MYALHNFCDTVDQDAVVHFLAPIMDSLGTLLADDRVDTQLREMVKRRTESRWNSLLVSAVQTLASVTSLANVAQAQFLPYFPPTMTLCLRWMQLDNTDDVDSMSMRAQSHECASVLALAVGLDEFRPFAEKAVAVALASLELDSEEVCRCAWRARLTFFVCVVQAQVGGFMFFTNVASAFGDDFAPLLERIMPHVLAALVASTAAFGGELEHSDSDDDGDELAGDAEDHGDTETSARTGALHRKIRAAECVFLATNTLLIVAQSGRNVCTALAAGCV